MQSSDTVSSRQLSRDDSGRLYRGESINQKQSKVCQYELVYGIRMVHTIAANSTHRRVKEDMSSKIPVGRVAMLLSEITLRTKWFPPEGTRTRIGERCA